MGGCDEGGADPTAYTKQIPSKLKKIHDLRRELHYDSHWEPAKIDMLASNAAPGQVPTRRRLFVQPTLAERSVGHDSVTTSEIVATLGLFAVVALLVRRFLRKREAEPTGY